MASFYITEHLYKKYVNTMTYIPIRQSIREPKQGIFYDKAERYVWDGDSVTHMALELASYMGFKRIYLLGVDHKFPLEKDSKGNVVRMREGVIHHFYEEKSVDGKDAKVLGASPGIRNKFYQAAREYGIKTGKFTIYNATRGGELEIFESVELEDILDGK